MGDMADFELETVTTEEEARLRFRTGHMDRSEAYDRGIIDELGYEIGTEIRMPKRTKRTKKS